MICYLAVDDSFFPAPADLDTPKYKVCLFHSILSAGGLLCCIQWLHGLSMLDNSVVVDFLSSISFLTRRRGPSRVEPVVDWSIVGALDYWSFLAHHFSSDSFPRRSWFRSLVFTIPGNGHSLPLLFVLFGSRRQSIRLVQPIEDGSCRGWRFRFVA